MGRPTSRASIPKTEGERLLRERTRRKSLATIARELGSSTSQDIISKWLCGTRRPTAGNRAAIYATYDIHVDTWDIVPKLDGELSAETAPLTLPTPPSESAAGNGLAVAPGPSGLPSTLDACVAVLVRIQAQQQRSDLTPHEQIKLADSETRLITLRARLERDAERSEDRIVREHPAWRRLMRLIRKTLAQHPAALKELAVALQEDLDSQESQAV